MSRPPRYEYLFEVEPSGIERAFLAIDRGSAASGLGGSSVGGDAPRLVVVHIAPPAIARDENARAAFAARASAVLPLHHPNLARTVEYVAEGRWCYWVSEFVEGQPLSQLLLARTKRGVRALSTRQILAIACDVLRGLEHAHGAIGVFGAPSPVVHGTLCPANVLVSYEGTVKVGSAVSLGLPRGGLLARVAERRPYLAPESLEGGPIDARGDVYAVGAMLWEALAGRPRAVDGALEPSGEQRSREVEPSLDGISPAVSSALAAVARRALARDPSARPSARAFRDELEELAAASEFRHEGALLFGFMCNHFCERHEALRVLLDERAPGISSALPDVVEASGARAIRTTAPALHEPQLGPTLVVPALDTLERSSMSHRKRLWFATFVVPVALGAVWAWPKASPERETSTVVAGLTPQPVPVAPVATPPVPAAVPAAAPAPAPEPPAEAEAEPPVTPPAREAAPAPASEAERPRLRRAPSPARRRPAASPGPSASAVAGRARAVSSSAAARALDAPGSEGPASADDTGVDLRSLRRRPPRAIDKQDPYSK